MPALRRRRTSTATTARSAARPTAPTDLKNPALGDFRRHAGAQANPCTTSSSWRTSSDMLQELDPRRARCRRRSPTSSTSGSTQGLQEWDISRDAPYFGFEIPGRAGQVLLRLAGRADRLHGQLQEPVRRAPACDFDDFWRKDSHGRAVPLHRQGHHLFPRPVLAGHAGRRRLPHADRRLRARLPDRQRPEDVQVARHLHQGAHLSGSSESRNTCAITSPPSSSGGVDDLDLNLDDFHAAGQQRPGRQGGQHRQPLRRFHHQALRRPAGGSAARSRNSTRTFVAAGR